MNRFIALTKNLDQYKIQSARKLSIGKTYTFQKNGEVTELPEMAIQVSNQKREAILRKSGWKKATLMMTINDFKGRPMLGRKILVQSQAPDVVPQADAKDINGGSAIFSDFWIKPTGTLRVIAVSTGQPKEAPSGVIHYTLPKNNVLKLAINQGFKEIEIAATSAAEAASKAGVKGTIGVDFKVVKTEGEVSGEVSRKRGASVSQKWKITIPTESLNIVVVQ